MVMKKEYVELLGYYGEETTDILEYFVQTEGCYFISSEDSLILGYRCNIADPYIIDINGEDAFITYATGDIQELSIIGEGIRYIGFHRRGIFKKYKFDTLIKRINKKNI